MLPAPSSPPPARPRAAALPGLLLGLALLAAWWAPPARASDPLRFTTTIEARDVTDWSIRFGEIGNRCSSWNKIDGQLVTRLAPTTGTLALIDPPGPVGPILSHSVEKTKVTVRMKTTGAEHDAFPCGCGPTSELGLCPPEQADTPLNVSCEQSDETHGLLGLVQSGKQQKPYGLASAPVEALIDLCAPEYQNLTPVGIGLAKGIPLPASIISDLRAMKVGGRKTIRGRLEHAGTSRCPAPTDELPVFCGRATFSMAVRRTA